MEQVKADTTQSKFEKYERLTYEKLLVYDEEKKKKEWFKIPSVEQSGEPRYGGRHVFYVTIGGLKHTKICIKPSSGEAGQVILI